MNKDVTKEIVKDISNSYYNVIIDGLEEQEHRFFILKSVIDFVVKLREKNINMSLDDIFNDTIINMIYDETDKYIGGN